MFTTNKEIHPKKFFFRIKHLSWRNMEITFRINYNNTIFQKQVHIWENIQCLTNYLNMKFLKRSIKKYIVTNKEKRHGVVIRKLFLIIELYQLFYNPHLSSDNIYFMFTYFLSDITFKI